MDYHDISKDVTKIEYWTNKAGEIEVKLFSGEYTVLHLVEDHDAPKDRIEDGRFYVTAVGEPTNLKWIRERKGIEMGGGIVDADYVGWAKNGRRSERQHNHRHLDTNVKRGELRPLTPV